MKRDACRGEWTYGVNKQARGSRRRAAGGMMRGAGVGARLRGISALALGRGQDTAHRGLQACASDVLRSARRLRTGAGARPRRAAFDATAHPR